MSEDRIPHLSFSTADIGEKDRLEAWRQQLAPMFDVLPKNPEEHFHARLDIYNLGPIIVGGVEVPAPHHYRRDRAWVARNDIDHYFLQLYMDGGYVGRYGERDARLRAGDIEILHFGQTLECLTSTSRTFGVLIPRDVLDQRIKGTADLHGVVLRREDPAGALLGGYLRTLRQAVASASLKDAPMIAEACISLVAACLRPTVETLAAAEPALSAALHDRVLDHVDAHLDDPTLGIETLCRDFRVSRSYLYRLFDAHGGVASFIRRRRLRRAMAMLTNPEKRGQRICDIAYACGFGEERTFSRVFRAEFGMTPSDARTAPAMAGASGDKPLAAEWVLNLAKRCL